MIEAALVAGEDVDDGIDGLAVTIVNLHEEHSARWLEEEQERKRRELEAEEMRRREEEAEAEKRREAEEEERRRQEEVEEVEKKRREEVEARLARIRAFRAKKTVPEASPAEGAETREVKDDVERRPAVVEPGEGKNDEEKRREVVETGAEAVEEEMEVELPVAGSGQMVRVQREPGKPGPSGTVYIGAPPERGRLLRAARGEEKATKKRTGTRGKAGPTADNVERQKGDLVSNVWQKVA
jgi:hypothetical protein